MCVPFTLKMVLKFNTSANSLLMHQMLTAMQLQLTKSTLIWCHKYMKVKLAMYVSCILAVVSNLQGFH